VSVTFTCPDAPSEIRRVPCDSPDLGLECTEGHRCGYCDDGWMEQHVTDCPEVNFSNDNTRAILALLQIAPEVVGSLTPSQIPAVLRRCMVVVNQVADRAHLVFDTCEEPRERRVVVNEDGMPEITTGPRIIHGGNTDEDTLRRLDNIQEILVYAAEHGYTVAWG